MFDLLSHPVVAIVVMLGLLIFIHEFGHYIVAKMLGVGVEAFSIGFGPQLIAFTYRNTKYQIACIPLGGFVKLAGTLATEKVPKYFRGKEMYRAPYWGRALILFAGPLANFLLAVVAYTYLGSVGIKHQAPVVGSVRWESPAKDSGFLPGDRIEKISDITIETWEEMTKVVKKSLGIPLAVVVERNGKQLDLVVTPKVVQRENFLGKQEKVGQIGIGYGFLSPVVTILDNMSVAAKAGFKTGDQIISLSAVSHGGLHQISQLESWSHFLSQLGELYSQGFNSFNVEVKAYSQLASKVSLEKKTTHYSLILPPISEKKLDSSKPDYFYNLGSVLAEHIGLVNSQLTLLEIQKPANRVLEPMDHIIAFNEKQIRDHYDLYADLSTNKHPTANITVNRQGVEKKLNVELTAVDQQKAAGKEVIYTLQGTFLGQLTTPPPVIEKYSTMMSALLYGCLTAGENAVYLVKSLFGLFSGQVPLQSIGGPILIAKLAGDSAKAGWEVFLNMLAMISINLAVINLIPIPILDGGQILMLAFESIRRRPLSAVAFENFQKVGFVLILSLVVLSTYNDLSRFWASMFKQVVGFFECCLLFT